MYSIYSIYSINSIFTLFNLSNLFNLFNLFTLFNLLTRFADIYCYFLECCPQNPSKFCGNVAEIPRKNFLILMGLPTFYLDS